MSNDTQARMSLPKNDDKEKRGIRPTIFIGLGGSGCRTVTLLRRHILGSTENPEFKKVVKFLKIDSRTKVDTGVSDDGDYMGMASSLTGESMVSLLYQETQNDKVKQSFRKWWRLENGRPAVRRMPFTEGAGQIRENGRLVFAYREGSGDFDASETLKYRLSQIQKTFSQDATSLAARYGVDKEVLATQVDIIILAGLAGGTGSSIALDVAFLCRNIFPHARNLWLVGFCDDVLSSTFPVSNKSEAEKSQLKANMLHSIAEIDYWMQPMVFNGKVYDYHWNDMEPADNKYPVTQPPIDNVILVSAYTDQGTKFPESWMYYEAMAQFLGRFYGSDASADYMSSQINAANGVFEKEEKSPRRQHESLRYGRIGMHRAFFPAQAILDYLVSRDICDALEQLFEHRHSEMKLPQTDDKGRPKKDNSGKMQYLGIIERKVAELKDKAGLSGWASEFMVKCVTPAGAILKKPLWSDKSEGDVRNVAKHAAFSAIVSTKKKAIDEYYASLDVEDLPAAKATDFGKELDEAIKGLCSWQQRQNISVRNLREVLTELHSAFCRELAKAQDALQKALGAIADLDGEATCGPQWLENQKQLFKRNIFISTSAVGSGAKNAAISWLKRRDQAKFDERCGAARKDWLDRCVKKIESLQRCLLVIQDVGDAKRPDRLRAQHEQSVAKAIGAMTVAQGRQGVESSVMAVLDDLRSFRPKWFPEYTDIANKQALYELYQRAVAGKVEDVEEAGPAMGLWHYLSAMRERWEAGGESADALVTQLASAWGEELERVMRAVANRRWATTVQDTSIWDVLLWKAKKRLSSDDTDAEVSLARHLGTEINLYADKMVETFGKAKKAGLAPPPERSNTLVLEEKQLVSVLESIDKDLTVQSFWGSHLGKWNRIKGQNPHEFLVLQTLMGYPANAFERLFELDSIFQEPEGLYGYCWADKRYPDRLRARLSHILNAKKREEAPPAPAVRARCCLAWHLAEKVGLEYAKKGSLHLFKFEGDKFEGFAEFFEKLPSDPTLSRFMAALQKAWNSIAADGRAKVLEEASVFIGEKVGRGGKKTGGSVVRTFDEPDRVKWLTDCARILKAESIRAQAARDDASICQDVASMFVESALKVGVSE